MCVGTRIVLLLIPQQGRTVRHISVLTELATSAASTSCAIGMTETAAIVHKLVRRVLVVRALLSTATAGAMGDATWDASPRSVHGTMATVVHVLTLVLRVLATIRLGATETAILVVSRKSAPGMAETAAVAHSIVLRALVVRAVRHGAMDGAMEIAIAAASTRSANGMVEIAAISPKHVT